jgi:glycosyltransferase involved in cell wall biosynthesis
MQGVNMKVLVSGYVGKKITGIGRNLISLLDNDTSNNKYIIYTNHDMNRDFQFNNPNVDVKFYNISKNSSIGNLLWTTFIFPFMAVKEGADLSLIPNFSLLLFKFRPVVVIMHDLIEFNVKNKFSPLKMFYRTKIADPITAYIADRIVTVSENSKRDIMHFLKVKKEKIKVVYNGVDKNKFHKLEEKETLGLFEVNKWPLKYILKLPTPIIGEVP